MAHTMLRHPVLEDERHWALLFGLVGAVAAILVSTYDVEESTVLALLGVSLLAVGGYWLRYVGIPVPPLLITAGAVVAQVTAADIDDQAEGHAFLVLLALFYGSFRDRNRRLNLVGLVIALPVPALLSETVDSDGWLFWTMGLVVCFWFGAVSYRLREVASELEEQRHHAAQRAVSDERRRIARDVHDLVGHSLSVMLLHLTGARAAVVERPDQAEEALARAEEVGREAMAEIRQTIGMLAEDPDQAPPVVPGLADVAALVEEYRTAGLDVGLTVSGDDGPPLDRARSLAIYRIVQEALVNATKHAVGSTVEVDVRSGPDGWTVRVSNGVGQPSATTGSADGLGLAGMAERARSVRGSLIAGPTGDGWRVEAILPEPS